MCDNSENVSKNLKDYDSVYDIDIDKVVLIRGDTPPDIKHRCLELCRDYLSGNWSEQTIDSIDVKRITGGMTNQIYYCRISDPNGEDVPQEVAIRLYGKKYFSTTDGDNERLPDVIISLVVSINGLGPKVFGVFEGGEIQRYYRHRQFKLDEQKDPKLCKQLFEKLARFHAMDIPLRKTSKEVFDMKNAFENAFKSKPLDELIAENDWQIFREHDLKNEIQWLTDMIVKTNSPIVFSHNDFLSSNVLILDDSDEEIIFCDFEYACYGRRGQDLGSIVCEWGRLWMDTTAEHNFPEDSVIKPLLEYYVEECDQIYGKQFSQKAINSLDQLLRESKLYSLVVIITKSFGVSKALIK